MHRASQRPGFTIIELLVVIAIIGVLTALSVGIVRTVILSQQQGNTEATMRTVMKSLNQHWTEVVNAARKETPSAEVLLLAGGDQARAKVIWTKLRLVEQFPQKYTDVIATSTNPLVPAWHYYIPQGMRKNGGYLRALGAANLAAPVEVQSATCILMALGIRRGGNTVKATDLGPAARDTDGDGLMELIDGFGHPMKFERFAANGSLQAFNPAKQGRGATYADPLDPDGLLLNATWFNTSYNSPLTAPATVTTCGVEFEKLVDPYKVYFAPPPSAIASYSMPVLISSAGTPTDLNDDIFSYTIRQN